MKLSKMFKNVFEIGGNALQYMVALNQVEDVLRIIGIVLSVIISILIIIDKIITWWKKAKADGEITVDEIHEGIEIIKEGSEEMKDHIEGKDNGKQ